ncbi:MAG: hypothetical protein D3905_11345 [Candidatus Electrothrix sp. AS4_5]|nr:hypothetical protein [Candidatus Electrothrix gigas]
MSFFSFSAVLGVRDLSKNNFPIFNNTDLFFFPRGQGRDSGAWMKPFLQYQCLALNTTSLLQVFLAQRRNKIFLKHKDIGKTTSLHTAENAQLVKADFFIY